MHPSSMSNPVSLRATSATSRPGLALAALLTLGLCSIAMATEASADDLSPPPSLGGDEETIETSADGAPDDVDLDELDDDSGDTESYFMSFWGQLHGGYITGSSDRFQEGSQGHFGFAAGMSITIIDIFTDVRLDGFDLDTAGMWNQIGIGVSFGIPLPYVKPMFGMRVAYLFAQFNEGARQKYIEEFEAGERDEEPSEKGLNISAQAGVDVKVIGPLYFNAMADLGYHILLPSVAESHGINFSVLGGMKLMFGF